MPARSSWRPERSRTATSACSSWASRSPPAPELCFLDEPSSGLTPVERARVLELIRRFSAERRTTFVIVEHDMDVVFSLAQWIVVMNRGQVLAEGPPAEIREHRAVREVIWARRHERVARRPATS